MAWINRDMIIYKLFYFFSIAGESISPFFAIYCKHLGLSASDIGIITAAKPFAVAISQPIIGLLTDTWKCPRITATIFGTLWIMSLITMGIAVPPFVREQSCAAIQQDLHPLPEFLLNNSMGSASYKYTEEECLTLMKEETLKSTDMWYEEHEADRSWMFTSESLRNVFCILMIAYSVTGLSFNPLHSIADAESVNTLEESGIDLAEYGKQRAFGSVGWATAPLIYGLWISLTRGCQIKCGIALTDLDYLPMFLVCVTFAVGTMITMMFFSYKWHDEESHDSKGQKEELYNSKGHMEQSENSKKLEMQVLKRLCTVPNLAIMFVTTFIGMCNGSVSGFLYWHLDSLGGTELVMAMASVCHGISEFLLGLVMGPLTRRFGYFPLMTVGIVTYMARFVYYAYIMDPWWILGSEILHSLTFLLTWNTSLAYLSQVVPEEYRTSLASLLNGLHFGLGNAIGYLLGGYLVDLYGSVSTFKIYSVVCAAIAIGFNCIFLTHDTDIKKDYDEESHKDNYVITMQPEYLPDFITVQQQPDD